MKTQNVNLQNCQLKNTDSFFFPLSMFKTFQLTKIDSIHIDISAYGGDNLIKNLAYLTQTHRGRVNCYSPVFLPQWCAGSRKPIQTFDVYCQLTIPTCFCQLTSTVFNTCFFLSIDDFESKKDFLSIDKC